MNLLLPATLAAFFALTCADVSHLNNYNYPSPAAQAHSQLNARTQIESIKSSVPLASFTIHQNENQGHCHGAQGYSSVQPSGDYNYNAPQQQHHPAAVQQQSYTGLSVPSALQTFSAPAAGSSQRAYLPPAPQQQRTAVTGQQASLFAPAPAPVPVQQSYQAPPVADVQHTLSAHQQTYSGPATSPILQQSFSAPGPLPVQQRHYSAAVDSHQAHFSAGQVQKQSFGYTGHQQLSFGGIESANLASNGAYNYQPQQQSFPSPNPSPIQQTFTVPAAAPVQQTHSVPANLQPQIFTNSEENSHNYQSAVTGQELYAGPANVPGQQHSFSAPATGRGHQSVTGSAGVERSSYNYQPPLQAQPQQHTGPSPQIQSLPAAIPVQLAGLTSANKVNTDSFNYQTPASVPTTAPALAQQGVQYSAPAPQKLSLPTPVSELTAPEPTPEVGTEYGENGGYVYRKF